MHMTMGCPTQAHLHQPWRLDRSVNFPLDRPEMLQGHYAVHVTCKAGKVMPCERFCAGSFWVNMPAAGAEVSA